MNSQYGRVVLITGASSGIGKSMAEYLKDKGYKVYGTSRKPQDANNCIKSENSGGFLKMLQMDICSMDSVKNVVSYIAGNEGTIDIVVNNAGMGIAGPVEETSPDEAFKQFDTNFFGMHRMIRQVAPIMRAQKNGLIVNISSLAAQFPIPYQSMYSASKAAIEAVSEVLRIELKPYGVKVVIIEPGDIKTGFTDSRIIAADAGEKSTYKEAFKKSLGVMINDETNGPDPIVVTRLLYRILGRKNPPVRVAVGLKYKVFIFLKRLLPERFALYVLSKMY